MKIKPFPKFYSYLRSGDSLILSPYFAADTFTSESFPKEIFSGLPGRNPLEHLFEGILIFNTPEQLVLEVVVPRTYSSQSQRDFFYVSIFSKDFWNTRTDKDCLFSFLLKGKAVTLPWGTCFQILQKQNELTISRARARYMKEQKEKSQRKLDF